MSLRFDTGLPRSTRELIVGALATKLSGLRRPNKYLAAIVSIPRVAGGKDDEDFFVELAKATQGRAPCVAIATGASDAETDESGLELEETIDIGIYVVSANQRGAVDGRLFADAAALADDTKDPGVFAMLQHVTERVQGADLGIEGVSTPRKVREDIVQSFDDVTVWEQRYRVDAHMSINPDRDETKVMTSIGAKHRGDGIPDASSLDPLIETVTNLDED